MQSRQRNFETSRRSGAVLLALSLLLTAIATVATAQVPARIHYEGRLFDEVGAPLAGPVDITIGLWDAVSGGSQIYGETHSAVALDSGAFAISIGEGTVTPGDPTFAANLLNLEVFLEVNVDGDTLSPRQALHPTAHAQVAASVPSVEADVTTLQSDVGTAQNTADAANVAAGTAQSAATAASSAAAAAAGAASSAQTTASTAQAAAEAAQESGDSTAGRVQDALDYIGSPLLAFRDVSGGWIDTDAIEMVADADGDPILGILRMEYGMMDQIPVFDIVRCSGEICDSSNRSEYLASGTEDSYTDCVEWVWDEDLQEDVCALEEEMWSVTWIYNVILGVGGNDFPYFAYYDENSDAFEFVACGNADCSAGNSSTTLIADSCGVQNATVAGSDGFPVFAYHDCDAQDLLVIKCDDAACSTSSSNIVDSEIGSWTGTFQSSIAILPNGNPVVSYYDNVSDDLGLIVCGNSSCSSSTSTLLDTTGNVGRLSKIAIGGDGFPAISYWRPDTDELKFLHCEDPSCSTYSIQTLVDDGTASDSNLQIDSSGNPVIGFRSHPPGSANFIRCRTHDCATKDEARPLYGTSLTKVEMLLDPDQHPIMASFDVTSGPNLAYLANHSDEISSNASAASTAQAAAASAQSTANTANTAATNAQAAVDALDGSGCGTQYAIVSAACPFSASEPYVALKDCSDAQPGSFCEGDGECGTSTLLNNCSGLYDVYYKVSGP